MLVVGEWRNTSTPLEARPSCFLEGCLGWYPDHGFGKVPKHNLHGKEFLYFRMAMESNLTDLGMCVAHLHHPAELAGVGFNNNWIIFINTYFFW